MSTNEKKWARAQVRNALGKAVADKASKAFCRAFVSRLGEKAAFLDAGSPQLVHAVLELEPQQPALGWASEEMVRARAAAEWAGALDGVRAALRTQAPGGTLSRAEALLTPKALLRHAFVREMQERCYRAAAPIRDALDRAVIKLNDESAAASMRKPVVQYCWLNQTFYTWLDAASLKEIAAHPLIQRIDTSRALTLQIKETGSLVGAVQHRQTTRHGGKGVVVAVIDSEVAMLDAVFQDRLVHKRDFTREGWGHPDQHGTAVAGIIAANAAEVQGIAPEVVIFNYKVEATRARGNQNDFFAACAIAQALEDGADIANCSWGTGNASDGTSREARACDMAWAAGMTVVHAVGNNGPPQVPADAKGVIVVGATDRAGKRVQTYSARGELKNGKRCPDMVAPGGVDENSMQMQSFLSDGSFGQCGFGTSFAAPHISGMLALLLEGEPRLTPDEQRTRIEKLCKPLGAGSEKAMGRGLPSFANAS